MISATFEYAAPVNVDAAAALLASGDAQVLSGGTSLITALKSRQIAPRLLVDLKKIHNLAKIQVLQDENIVRIGATATLAEISEHQYIAEYCPLLREAARSTAVPQLLNRKTIGGSIAVVSSSADIWASLLVAEANIHMLNANGARHIAAVDFFSGICQSMLESGGLIAAVDVPFQQEQTGSAYVKQADAASGKTVCGVAISLTANQDETVDRCRIALVGATALPMRLATAEKTLAGSILAAEPIAAAWQESRSRLAFVGDSSASEEYRAHLAGVFFQRALIDAMSRIGMVKKTL